MESCTIKITNAAQEYGNLNLRSCGEKFFPVDVFGSPSRADGIGVPITIHAEGLATPIKTDIPTDRASGRPRWIFRERSWVKRFVHSHNLSPGDVLSLERVDSRMYRLSVARSTIREPNHTFLEFFAGIGLVRLGLQNKGWRLLYANDIDPEKMQMYDAHFKDADTHFELSDIHDVDASGLPHATLATASFPCTDLSLAGARQGLNGRQSSSFFGFLRILRELGNRRPLIVLLENVTAFLTSHRGSDFHHAMLQLNQLGYSVDPFVLDAKWFVPQSRPRLFVVATLLRDPHANTRCLLLMPNRVRPSSVTDFITTHQDIRWALRALPDPPTSSHLRLQDILENLSNDAPEWWSKERAEYLYNQMSERHRAIADDWITKKRYSYGTVFRRVRLQADGCKRSMAELRSDGFAGCLRTPKGGSGRQILFKAGYGKYAARLLTPRECAHLMGADDFSIQAGLNQALFGFGDAVCVPAIAWIAENYLNPLVAQTNASQRHGKPSNDGP